MSMNRSEWFVNARQDMEAAISEFIYVARRCETNPLAAIESALVDAGFDVEIVKVKDSDND